MRNDFAVIIISHGRPNCSTVKLLREQGYSGKIILIVDDEDDKKDEYIKRHENVHIFHKHEWFDVADNRDNPRTVGVFARNECLKVAKAEKLKYYLELDDDLKTLSYRYNEDGHLRGVKVRSFDKVVDSICRFFDTCKVNALGFGNQTDYIGGVPTFEKKTVGRMILNSFFLRTKDEFIWRGRSADDFTTLISQQKIGNVWLKFIPIQASYDVWTQKKQSNLAGGSIDVYNELGAFFKLFYAVVFNPDCVKMRMTDDNCDCSISTVNAFPLLISGKWKK